MKSFFSKKLYWEGIKKIRVVGIAFTAISTILCGLIPFVSMLGWYATEPEYRSSYAVSAIEFCIPAYFILMIAALIIVINMFSFLNKRSESDFYHAIPYKRSCVYISFMAACLSWLVLAAVLSVAAAAFFFWINPGTSVALSIPFINLGICILLAATLAATTVVAMTLTGTIISNLLIACLMFCFIPVIGFLFITALDQVVPLLYVPLTPARFLQPEFSLPIAVFEVMFGANESILYNNAALIIYTVIITVLLLVAGCLLYMRRNSEMASKSAPNKILQHVYRCAISLPFALLAICILIYGEEFAFFIVLAVITLLVYFMYELITTKRFKNLLKAVPFLGVLVAGCLLFIGGTELTKVLTLAYKPDADDMASVGQISDYEMMYYGSRTYEDLQTESIEIDHPEAFEIVANTLAESIERTKNGTFYGYDDYYDKGSYDVRSTYQSIKITDKSGKVCGRYIRMSDTDQMRLQKLFLESDDYADAMIKMPTDSEVQNIYSYGYNFYIDLSDKEHQKLWESLVEEYDALSKDQKLQYKSGSMSENVIYDDGVITEWEDSSSDKESISPTYSVLTTLEVSGTVGTQTFNSSYDLRTDLFPKTCALYATLVNESESYGESHYSETFGPANLQEILPLIESDRMDSFSLQIGDLDSYYYEDNYRDYSAEQVAKMRQMVEFILNNIAPVEDADHYISVSLDIHLDEYEVSQSNCTMIALSQENYQALEQMVQEFYMN